MKLISQNLVVRDDAKEWEQIAFAEVLTPMTVNGYGDIYTPEAIIEFCHQYAIKGYQLDINHDNKDVTGTGFSVVESFIARPGDPDFLVGSWVVGIKVADKDIWQRILDGELNGFSFEAEVFVQDVTFDGVSGREVHGTTSENPVDGHTHDYMVVLDLFDFPIAGGTTETNGHSHRILSHTTTEVSEGHNHRFQVLQPLDE